MTISSISTSTSSLLSSEEANPLKRPLFAQIPQKGLLKKLKTGKQLLKSKSTPLFIQRRRDLDIKLIQLMKGISHIQLKNQAFYAKTRMTKKWFFNKLCHYAKEINSTSWPPSCLKTEETWGPCIFRQCRITLFDILKKALEHILKEEPKHVLLQFIPVICKRYRIIDGHRECRHGECLKVKKKSLLIKKKFFKRKVRRNEDTIALEKKIFQSIFDTMETFNNHEEREIYHSKKRELEAILLMYYPFLFSNHPSSSSNSSPIQTRSQTSLFESIPLRIQNRDREPSNPLMKKIQELQKQVPYVNPKDGLPYYPKSLSIKEFCKTVFQLAKKIEKISEPNSTLEMKNLRLDILNRLDSILEFLREELVRYVDLPSPKPNYNKYHTPILKLWKKSHGHFKKMLGTFDCNETRELYNSMSTQLVSREATLSLLESTVSKWSWYACFCV